MDQCVIRVDQSGSEWVRVGQSGSEWIRVGQSGSEWIRVDQSGSEWIRVGQSGSEWVRVGQSGSEHGLVLPIFFLFISCIQNLQLAILAEEILTNMYVQRSKNYTKNKKCKKVCTKIQLKKLNYRIYKIIKFYNLYFKNETLTKIS